MRDYRGWRQFFAVIAVVTLAAGSALAADRVVGYETGDILEAPDGVTASWERVTGSANPYPDGINIGATTSQAHTGADSAYIVTGWQETNGDLVYTIVARTTKISFYYLVASGTLEGHQGYYYFSVDGTPQVSSRIPAIRLADGGSGWLYCEVTGLDDAEHTFQWRLVDKDYWTSSWYFWDDVTLDPLPIEVAIDVKPGSEPSPINLGSEGVIPVAIYGSDTFDVADIDQTSLSFEGNAARVKGKKEKIGSFSDVNGDGFTDLVVQFPTEGLLLSESDNEATMTGALTDGTPITGTDAVVIVPPQP